MASASHGLADEAHHAAGQSSRYGPNGAEVDAFIRALPSLSEAQWTNVLATRRHVASVTKESSGHEVESIRSILAAARTGEGGLPEPMSAVAQSLVDLLESRNDDEVVASWQAVSALVRRYHMPAVSFAAHYAPFATAIPLGQPDAFGLPVRRYLSAIKRLTGAQCEFLARSWRLDHEASAALLKAVAKNPVRDAEQAAAMAALVSIPVHLPGDPGWAAVKTTVHGGRALGSRAALSRAELTALWAPIEEAIPLASLVGAAESKRSRAGVSTTRSPRKSATAAAPEPPAEGAAPADAIAPEMEGAAAVKPPKPRAARSARASARAGPYGPNSAEVAAFLKALPDLSAIQWLRVLDRRRLVASVTREGSAEPASVVRSILSAVRQTSGLEAGMRARIFAAVERAGFAVENKARLTPDEAGQHYGPLATLIPLDQVNAASFAARLDALNEDDWRHVAAEAPPVGSDVVGHLVSAGAGLVDFLARRTDDEAVTTWHAVSALARRHQLSPMKFAVSYAPFASAIPVTSFKSQSAAVERYVGMVGKLSAHQCELLARPWQVPDALSVVLSRAMADGSARRAEEAAALAAVVTVPMRMTGNEGWAAARTAAFGGRVVGARANLSPEEVEALWRPIEPAIPLASLDAGTKARR
jgi:hypothetical protein